MVVITKVSRKKSMLRNIKSPGSPGKIWICTCIPLIRTRRPHTLAQKQGRLLNSRFHRTSSSESSGLFSYAATPG